MPTAERPLRVEEFDGLFAATVRSAARPAPTRLRVFLAGGGEIAAIARDLISRETACCSFFSFTLRASAEESELEVRVPAAQAEVLDAVQERVEAIRVGGRGVATECR